MPIPSRSNRRSLSQSLNSLKLTLKEMDSPNLTHTPDKTSGSTPPEVQVIPTGSLRLDIALGQGGIRRGCFIEIAGPESSGKTSLSLHIIAEAQRLGGVCAYIDADQSLDTSHAKACGVERDSVYISQPLHAQQALETLEALVNSGSASVIVLDSVTSLISLEELNAPLGEEVADTSQTMLSQTMRRLINTLKSTNTTILLILKTDLKRGPIYHKLSSNTARMALQLMASQRIKCYPVQDLYHNGHIIGKHIRINVVKNQFSPFYQTAEIDIMYTDGIDKTAEIIDLGMQLSIISIEKTRISYETLSLGKNFQRAVEYLKVHPSISGEIEGIIRQRLISKA